MRLTIIVLTWDIVKGQFLLISIPGVEQSTNKVRGGGPCLGAIKVGVTRSKLDDCFNSLDKQF